MLNRAAAQEAGSWVSPTSTLTVLASDRLMKGRVKKPPPLLIMAQVCSCSSSGIPQLIQFWARLPPHRWFCWENKSSPNNVYRKVDLAQKPSMKWPKRCSLQLISGGKCVPRQDRHCRPAHSKNGCAPGSAVVNFLLILLQFTGPQFHAASSPGRCRPDLFLLIWRRCVAAIVTASSDRRLIWVLRRPWPSYSGY